MLNKYLMAAKRFAIEIWQNEFGIWAMCVMQECNQNILEY